MLQVCNSSNKTAQHLRTFLCITIATVFLSSCAGRRQPVSEQPVQPVVQTKEVVLVPTLILINKTYKTKNVTPVRSAPDPDASVVISLQANEKFTAVAKVKDSDWIVVGKGDHTIGFVHQALVRPITLKKKTKKTPLPQKDAINLDTTEPAEKGIDLDAITDEK